MIPDAQTLQRANEIVAQIDALRTELLGLFGSSGSAPAARRGKAPSSSSSAARPKAARNMSAEGRARIAAAAKARWAKYRAAKKKADKSDKA